MSKANVLNITFKRDDGWLIAYLDLDSHATELCRMVSAPSGAALYGELIDDFQALATRIVESIIRDDQPDAQLIVKHIGTVEPGNA